MKIIISCNSCWNLYNFRFDLIKKLIKKNCEIIVLSPYDEYVDYLINVGCQFREIKINQRGVSLIDDFFLLLKYFFLINKIKPDFYLSFTIKPNIYGSFISNLLNIKTINTITGLGSTFINKNIITYLEEFLYFLSLRNSKKIFFHNKYDLKYFTSKKIVNKKYSSLIMGSGINLKLFNFSLMKFKKNKITFLFIGRIIKEKGFLDLIEAIKIIKKKYNNIEFVVIGKLSKNFVNDITFNDIEKWTTQKLISYYGHKKDVKKYIKDCHCLVLPSYREGLSRAIIESIVIGRPIITNDVPGCKDLVEHNKNGYLCKKNDYFDLSKMIEKFIKLKDKKKYEMGIYGYNKYALSLDVDKVNDKYIDLIYN